MSWLHQPRILGWMGVIVALPAAGCCETGSTGAVGRPLGADAGARVASPPNTTNPSFHRAKQRLAEVYADHRETFYCGCAFDERKRVIPEACGFAAPADDGRARRIEWEHIVPAELFGRSFAAWRDGHPDCVDRKGRSFRGRQCARKTEMAFRYLEADMYNLVPAIGSLNERRAHAAMGVIDGERREFGACDFEVEGSTVEPRPAVRGDVARIYQYMDAAYPGRGILSEEAKRQFEAWSRDDPVDAWECERARRIARHQGNLNTVVDRACREAGSPIRSEATE